MHCQNEIFYVYLEVNELESLVDDVTLKHFGRQEHSDVAVRLRNKIKVLKPLELYYYRMQVYSSAPWEKTGVRHCAPSTTDRARTARNSFVGTSPHSVKSMTSQRAIPSLRRRSTRLCNRDLALQLL